MGSRETPPLGSQDGGVQAEGMGSSRDGAGEQSGVVCQRGHAVAACRPREPQVAFE